MNTPAIAIHGGSGIITESLKKPEIKKYFQTLQQALDGGFAMLTDNSSALEAVCRAVCILEDCELFNGGKGSVFTAKGKHQMDAALMEGVERKAGAVAGVEGVKNPVLLAKAVIENTQYVFLGGKTQLNLLLSKAWNLNLHPTSIPNCGRILRVVVR